MYFAAGRQHTPDHGRNDNPRAPPGSCSMDNSRKLQRLFRAPGNEPIDTVSDTVLIASIAKRDKQALELLFARHNVRIYRFVARFTGNSHVTEDVVSEVFLDVWRGADRFRATSQVSTWLFAIARYKAISARKRHPELHIDDDAAADVADTADDPETSLHHSNRSALIRKCLMQLPQAQREILDLVYYHEKTVAEVAQIVGIPSGTVKTRMFRARGRMAELLKGAGVSDMQAV
jgi:RNA polymerase sigma-70 factor (ECF subfamily)